MRTGPKRPHVTHINIELMVEGRRVTREFVHKAQIREAMEDGGSLGALLRSLLPGAPDVDLEKLRQP